MKRSFCLPLIFLMLAALAFSACGHTHVWSEATCTAPAACAECGKTEGEALPHTWQEATCAAPKTCADCGLTEGDALPHTWAEATFWSPMTCTVCGAEVGDPLPACFEEHGLVINTVEGETYDYVTCCYNRPELETVGTAAFENYRVFLSDEDHPAQEGYEWRCVDAVLTFADDNAWKHGMRWATASEDYYDAKAVDDSKTEDGEYTMNWNGVDYAHCRRTAVYETAGWSNHIFKTTIHWSFLVPAGYDGAVAALYNSAAEWGEGQYIYDVADENTLFFRLN